VKLDCRMTVEYPLTLRYLTRISFIPPSVPLEMIKSKSMLQRIHRQSFQVQQIVKLKGKLVFPPKLWWSPTLSPLTWYENWFFHPELKWGRTLIHYKGAQKIFGIDKRYLRAIHHHKLSVERKAQSRWPKYAPYEEDMQLRKQKWNAKYGERNIVKTRPVMWDMAGIKSYTFSTGELQRVTYSKYYNGNCMKGGIFCQLCDWGDTWFMGWGCQRCWLQQKAGNLQ